MTTLPTKPGLRTLLLCRHAQRIDTEHPTWQASSSTPLDPPLSARGVSQARLLARRLRASPIQAICVSPYLRTLATAQPVADLLDQPMYVEPGLGEWLNPAWSDAHPLLQPDSRRDQLFPRAVPADPPIVTPRYPEPAPQLRQRVRAVLGGLLERFAGTLLCVTHGHVISAALSELAGVADVPPIQLCSLTRLDLVDGAWRLGFSSDIDHLLRFERRP